jgi:flagellar motor switch protein FliN/FliY
MLSPTEVLSAARSGLNEASDAASRALGCPIKVAAQSATPFLPDILGSDYSTAGLLVLLKTDLGGAVFLIPETGGALPSWYGSPTESQASQLATLAQEWGMTLWPDSAMPNDFAAARVNSLREAVSRGGIGPDAGAVSLSLTSGETTAQMLLIWPIDKPDEVFRSSATTATKWTIPAATHSRPLGYSSFEDGVEQLPRYSRSLLKVKVPVRVTLARSRQPIARILSLDQGSILNFTMSCDEPLTVEVGEECVAEGEVIRVGDKFGVRVTGMILPSERFLALDGGSDSHSSHG